MSSTPNQVVLAWRAATFALGIGILAAGCAAPPRWEKVGATQNDFYSDSYQCQMEATRAFPSTPEDNQPLSAGRYSVLNLAPISIASNRAQATKACMFANGWRQVSY